MTVERDPDYDWIPPIQDQRHPWALKKVGVQCGECGMKFEYGKAYGYACCNSRCPRGVRASGVAMTYGPDH